MWTPDRIPRPARLSHALAAVVLLGSTTGALGIDPAARRDTRPPADVGVKARPHAAQPSQDSRFGTDAEARGVSAADAPCPDCAGATTKPLMRREPCPPPSARDRLERPQRGDDDTCEPRRPGR